MRKTYPLRPAGKHPDRVLDAIKHDIRRYIKRERRRDLPEGAQFWDFDCRFGADQDSAQPVAMADLMPSLDALVSSGAAQCYVELLAKPAVWQRRPVEASAPGDHPAQSPDGPDIDPPEPDQRAG